MSVLNSFLNAIRTSLKLLYLALLFRKKNMTCRRLVLLYLYEIIFAIANRSPVLYGPINIARRGTVDHGLKLGIIFSSSSTVLAFRPAAIFEYKEGIILRFFKVGFQELTSSLMPSHHLQ